jgi:hypothetical protein
VHIRASRWRARDPRPFGGVNEVADAGHALRLDADRWPLARERTGNPGVALK